MLDDSPRFKMIELDETRSTNSFLRDYRPLQPVDMTLVTAEYQTAGRGQGSNSWESERGKNLLFSLLVNPAALPVVQAFVLSEAIALSIREAVARFVHEEVTIKWPNDIYVGDSKIAGILIENTLQGACVARSIMGCGVNVNQENFVSDALNPVSLRQLLQRDIERSFVLDAIVEGFTRRYDLIQRSSFAPIVDEYRDMLYRRTGYHPFRDADGTFEAEIADVELSGHLVLRRSDGKLSRYAFKEVAFLQ